MPRTRCGKTVTPSPKPVAIIDLTEDSPSNTALRLSRTRTRRVEEESDVEFSDDDEAVIPLDDSTEGSNDAVQRISGQQRLNSAIVINLEDTINLDEKSDEKTAAKQVALNELPNKKGSLSCPICFDNLADDNMTPMSTPCGHVYCLQCLTKVTQKKKKCALCQRSISFGKCIRLHI